MKPLKLIIGCLFLAFATAINAQEQELPVDSFLKKGQLPNGLTYYIRHNPVPKGMASFYFLQKTGSMVEEDEECGLAHFTEHMCFNGTKHFPPGKLVSWMSSLGLTLGKQYNAFTSFDETYYPFNYVPVERESVQDSMLLVLRDWAGDVLFSDEEIDKERKVICEEIRTRNNGAERMARKSADILLDGSKYTKRWMSGTSEQIASFKNETLRNFYKTWYRPDLQGIAVVGDIDVERIEKKIVELFSDLKNPANEKPREYEPDYDLQEPRIAVITDKENTESSVELLYLHQPLAPIGHRNTVNFHASTMIEKLISRMLTERIESLVSSENSPVGYVGVEDGQYSFCNRQDAFGVLARPKTPQQLVDCIKSAYREVARAAQHGFTQGELKRASELYLNYVEDQYNSRAQKESTDYAESYMSNFFFGTPMINPEINLDLWKQILPQISLEMVNNFFVTMVNPQKMAVNISMPYTQNLLTNEEVLQALSEVGNETIEAYVDNVEIKTLLKEMPKAGKVVKETYNKDFDATEWTLSNGVKVIVKKTDFTENEVVVNAVALNGHTVYSDSEAANIKSLREVFLNIMRCGELSTLDMQNFLIGKNVDFEYVLEPASRWIKSRSSVKDVQSMLEILHAAMTKPYINKGEFEAMRTSAVSNYKEHEASNPMMKFFLTRDDFVYNSPRYKQITSAELESCSYERIMEIAKEQFATNAAEFCFSIAGNINPEELKPLVEQYIASLPGKAVKTKANGIKGLEIKPGPGELAFDCNQEEKQTMVSYFMLSKQPVNMKNFYIAPMVSNIATRHLSEEVRERMGAVYSINCQYDCRPFGEYPFFFVVLVPMKNELTDASIAEIRKIFADMAKNVSSEDLMKAKEELLNTYSIGIKNNSAWAQVMARQYLLDMNTITKGKQAIESITSQDIQNFVSAMLKENNIRVVRMKSE